MLQNEKYKGDALLQKTYTVDFLTKERAVNNGEVRFKNKHIDEEVLYKAFVSSFNALVENKEHFIERWKDEDGDELERHRANEFIEIMEKVNIEEFDIDLYFRMVEKMVVFEDRVRVGFLDGTEVECIIE